MKKLIALIVILVLSILTVACEKEPRTDTTSATEIRQVQEILSISTTHQIDNKEKDEIKTDNGGGYIESGKYRQCYYDVPYDFIVLVGKEEYEKWYNETYEFNPDRSQFVSFIQYFNISKEVFEKTNLQMAKSFAEFNPTMRPMDYENQQTYEIYNVDIIYTFDYDIINEYYLTPEYPYCADFEYEAALKNGTYETRTTDWIDIEEMEAEIIAKYGEAEIITEPTDVITETSAAIPEETKISE